VNWCVVCGKVVDIVSDVPFSLEARSLKFFWPEQENITLSVGYVLSAMHSCISIEKPPQQDLPKLKGQANRKSAMNFLHPRTYLYSLTELFTYMN
jgi:hypothetical protein